MPVHNTEIAERFETLADLLEIEGANPFRIRAYRNAALVIRESTQSLQTLVEEGADLTQLPAIGKDLAEKIRILVESGRLPLLEKVSARTPVELSEMMLIDGLGPKRVQALHRKLKVNSLEQLRRLAEEGRIRELEGFGEKIETAIREHLERYRGREKRMRRVEVEEVAQALVDYLEAIDGVRQVTVAGSFRRKRETVGDLDLLVTARRGTPVVERFTKFDEVAEVIAQGKTRSTVRLRSGLHVDLRLVAQVSYGAALHYFTGSKGHNIAVRKRAVKRGYKLNEYGLYKDDKRIAGRSEKEVYAAVDLPYIEPELRENRGEIEAAEKGRLPQLITLEAIRGDLHSHSSATDGRNSIEEMAEAAMELGYEYLAISDHSQRVTMARGLNEKRLREELAVIDRLNDKLQGITLLKAMEVDILDDGRLDMPDTVLRELDLTICSVHYQFNLSEQRQTERIIRAMDNPLFTIFAHPSGRLINEREGYEVDMELILEAASERGCHLEVNAQPLRLDLDDVHCKAAKELGLKLSIASDAHSTAGLANLRLGIDQARRGWLEAADVLNTRPLKELKKLLKR